MNRLLLPGEVETKTKRCRALLESSRSITEACQEDSMLRRRGGDIRCLEARTAAFRRVVLVLTHLFCQLAMLPVFLEDDRSLDAFVDLMAKEAAGVCHNIATPTATNSCTVHTSLTQLLLSMRSCQVGTASQALFSWDCLVGLMIQDPTQLVTSVTRQVQELEYDLSVIVYFELEVVFELGVEIENEILIIVTSHASLLMVFL